LRRSGFILSPATKPELIHGDLQLAVTVFSEVGPVNSLVVVGVKLVKRFKR
jgi:hypothetical protein